MTPRWRTWPWIWLAGLCLLAPASPAETAQGSTKPRARRDRASYERRLAERVRHELVMLPYLSVFDHLAFQVHGNQVTLLGQVARPSLRPDAERAVKRIEGVARVVNRIEVLPVSINDDRLRRAVYRAIFSDPALQRYAIQPLPPIHIIVKRGHVTLEGIVASRSDRNLAFIRASGVPGVFSLTNHLAAEK